MIADLARVFAEFDTAYFVVGGFDRFEIRLQWRLRVHHYVLAAGQLHNQIGTQSAIAGTDCDLLVEIAESSHAGDLDHALQLNFSPASAH